MITISIIIPSFNQGHFIKKTIDSIINQSYKNFEIIVMDGASTDATIGILKEYGDQITWFSESDRGQTHAINKGLALAKGEIITYLNSDDYYLPGSLMKIAELFKRNKKVQWITGDYIIVDENGSPIQSYIVTYKRYLRKFLTFGLLTILNPIVQPSTFIRKEFVEKTGLFNENLEYTMDYEYWLRLIKSEKPFITEEKISAFRIHKQSKGGHQFRKQFAEELKVASVFQNNHFYLLLHRAHNKIIELVYSITK